MEKVVSKIGCFLLFLFVSMLSYGQPRPLQRNITSNFNNIALEDLLGCLEKEAGFHFSYNPDLLSMDSLVDLNMGNVTVKKALDNLLGQRISYKEIGNYVILRDVSTGNFVGKNKSKEEQYVISGYLIDRLTGNKITNASVFQIDELNSTLTDPNGFYRLMVSSTNEAIELSFSRKNYLDTFIVVEPTDHNINVELMPRSGKLKELPFSKSPTLLERNNIENIKLVKLVVPENHLTFANNLEGYYAQRLAQISFLPVLGSNRNLSGLISNNFSLNILAGYNAAIMGAEVGGFTNIVRKDVSGVQIGGFANIVGGNIAGVQVAGFINNCKGSMSGVQVAGFNNVVLDTIVGIQVAGFSNVVKGKFEGIQVAGFGNITTKNVDGVEVAGFFNVALLDVKNAQIGGFINYGRNIIGTQLAGFTNISTGRVEGAQVSGFLNISRQELKGVQLSGFLNYAKKVRSLQLGFINISDSCTGIPIGFFSFVKSGFRKFEFYSTETTQFNVAFKTGIPRFHNIVSVGVGRKGGIDLWGFGYGFGSYFKINTNRMYMNVDLTSNHLSFNGFTKLFTNTLYKFNANLNYRLSKRITLVGGPSFNMHTRDMIYAYPEVSDSYTFEGFRNGVKFRAWFGYHLGVRL